MLLRTILHDELAVFLYILQRCLMHGGEQIDYRPGQAWPYRPHSEEQ